MAARRVVGDRAQTYNKQIERERMLMTIKATGNDDLPEPQIYLLDPSCEETDMSQDLTDGIHNRCEIQVAHRNVMKHRGKRGKAIAVDQRHSTAGFRPSTFPSSIATMSPAKPSPRISIRVDATLIMTRVERCSLQPGERPK
ncbi:MAG: hypothetical protein WCC21_03635 [Candidatus Acidiferrales bacterium]